MRNILRENDSFQKFSRYCEEKAVIEEELKDADIPEEKRRNLEKRLLYLKKGISELGKVLQNEIKIS